MCGSIITEMQLVLPAKIDFCKYKLHTQRLIVPIMTDEQFPLAYQPNASHLHGDSHNIIIMGYVSGKEYGDSNAA